MSKTFAELIERANEINDKYDELNVSQGQPRWNESDVMAGFVGDVGDLSKLIMANKRARVTNDVDAKIAHELSDCLWSITVLAKKLNVNLEDSFMQTMDGLEAKIEDKLS